MSNSKIQASRRVALRGNAVSDEQASLDSSHSLTKLEEHEITVPVVPFLPFLFLFNKL